MGAVHILHVRNQHIRRTRHRGVPINALDVSNGTVRDEAATVAAVGGDDEIALPQRRQHLQRGGAAQIKAQFVR